MFGRAYPARQVLGELLDPHYLAVRPTENNAFVVVDPPTLSAAKLGCGTAPTWDRNLESLPAAAA
jgi:hypothetical protein